MKVVFIDLCPSKSEIVLIGVSCSISRVAKACRMACALATIPALRKNLCIKTERATALRGIRLSIVRNTSG
jgi:hypothetical protein